MSRELPRENLFTLIRWLLALAVIFSHSWPLALGPAAEDPLQRLTGTFTLGSLAVNWFLVLSGYLVAASLERSPDGWSFLRKRLLRIYPAFVLLMLVQAFVIVPLITPQPFTGYGLKQLGILAYDIVDLHGYGYPYGGLYSAFTQNPFPGETNGSLWTIRYEFLCYLLLMGLALWQGRLLLPLALLCLVPTVLDTALPWHRLLTALFGAGGPWPRLLLHFLLGVLAWRWRGRLAYSRSGVLVAVALLAVSVPLGPPVARAAFALAGAYLVLATAQATWAKGSWLTRIPDYSYGIYLYGFVVQQLVALTFARYAPGLLQPLVLFAAAAPLAVVLGAASWHLVEERALRFKGRAAAGPAARGVAQGR